MVLHHVLCLYVKAINYLGIFMGHLSMSTRETMTVLSALGTLLFLLGCQGQLKLIHLIIVYLIMVGCYLLETCIFLVKGRTEVVMDRREGGKELGRSVK